MILHVSVGSNDIGKARIFYDAVLAVVGLRRMNKQAEGLDYGSGTMIFCVEAPTDGQPAMPGNGVHIAFGAHDRAMVDHFHAVALAHGGRDAGAPGIRANYDAHYYAAFVYDPDGNKIEAVTYAGR